MVQCPDQRAKTDLVGSGYELYEWVGPIASYLDLDAPRKKILRILMFA